MASPSKAIPAPAAPGAGGGVREVVDLALPVVLTQMSSTAMGVVDSAIVGRLGPTALAAVGLGTVWAWTLHSFFYGTATGVQTFVSQADGAGRPRECGAWAWQGLYCVVPATALFAALLWPHLAPAVGLLGTSPELETAASTYLAARLPGEVGLAAMMVLTSFFRGFGDTKTPLYVSLLANAINAVLDYGLVYGEWGLPAWGVRGAGIATSVGHWTGALVLLWAFRRRRVAERHDTRPVRPDAAAIRRFLRTGAPIGGQWFVPMTSFSLFTTLVARMGDVQMAASQAFVMLLSLSFMQALGISVAAATLVGRYVGAERPDAVERSYRSCLGMGAVLGGAVGLLFVLAPEALLRIFTDDPRVIALGRPLLLMGAVFQLCDAMAIITQGALRGAGDTRFPFWVEAAIAWGVFVPLAYVVGITFGAGLTGAWLAGLVYVALLAWILVRRFRSGVWRQMEI